MYPIKTMCLGGYYGCALSDSSELKCWGHVVPLGRGTWPNENSLGDTPYEVGNYLPSIYLGNSNLYADSISCGWYHYCVKLTNGLMKCTGDNGAGQLGYGVTTQVIGIVTNYYGNTLPYVNIGNGLTIYEISAGFQFTCVVVANNNKVKCIGFNDYGQLGYEHTAQLGSSSIHMGDNLAYVNLGNDVSVSKIVSGYDHSCVILLTPATSIQRMKCWGRGNSYQLGYGNTVINRGDNVNEMGDYLPLIDLGIESKVKQISLGQVHTCALTINDNLKCWGVNNQGVLGNGETSDIYTMGNSLPSVTLDSSKRIKYLSSGFSHNCILYDDEYTLKCFGSNIDGQLGQGDTQPRGLSPSTIIPNISSINLGLFNTNITSIYTGGMITCIVYDSYYKNAKCFGSNRYGKLLIGSTTTNIGTSLNQMGINLKSSIFVGLSPAATSMPTPSYTYTPTSQPTTLTFLNWLIPVLIILCCCRYCYAQGEANTSSSPTPQPVSQAVVIAPAQPKFVVIELTTLERYITR